MTRTTRDTGPRNGRSARADQPAAPSGEPPGELTGPPDGALTGDDDPRVADWATGNRDRSEQGPDWTTYLERRRLFRRLAALALSIVVLGAGGAFVGATLWPETSAARAELLYPVTQEQPTGFLREDRNMTTQLVLIQSRPVLSPVATEQGRSVEDLQSRLEASVLDDSELIEVEVTDRSPERAMGTLQAVVDSYLEFNESSRPLLRENLEAEIAEVTEAYTTAQSDLAAQQTLVNEGTDTADTLVPLQSEVQEQQSRLRQLQSQLDSLNYTPVAQLVTAPYDAGVVHPRPAFAALTGGLVGLLLAAAVVAVVARNRTMMMRK